MQYASSPGFTGFDVPNPPGQTSAGFGDNRPQAARRLVPCRRFRWLRKPSPRETREGPRRTRRRMKHADLVVARMERARQDRGASAWPSSAGASASTARGSGTCSTASARCTSTSSSGSARRPEHGARLLPHQGDGGRPRCRPEANGRRVRARRAGRPVPIPVRGPPVERITQHPVPHTAEADAAQRGASPSPAPCDGLPAASRRPRPAFPPCRAGDARLG